MKDFKPCGALAVSNWGGIEIEINDTFEAIRYCWSYGEPEKEKVSRWQKTKYSSSGREYFVSKSRRYYLDEFMRYQ